MFEKLHNRVSGFANSFEKVIIFRNYAEFLLEKDKNSILANSKIL